MNLAFYKLVEESTAHRLNREFIRDYVIQNPEKLKFLMEIALNENDKIHVKACWSLELIFELKLELILPFLDDFIAKIPVYKNDSAIRPVSKICLFLSKSKTIKLSENQETKIIETCLDWLIQDEKVASKAYSMRALHNFGKKHSWINEELKMILSQDYPNHSAAYKEAAKDILKKLK
ncbi:hypothetical protein G6N05_13340 [Flavobacterium sp. F372]|uniref:Adenylosuccinate lyase n=1 Tax=Flavobacterium bernardetii TaxID=2813823 RepID=A0ABR7J1U4_9FLAO|nr:hypothetical protein [Flavobacterium bernardetii]MBC5835957.1 hypothetical protein [Flavobacterium bernardetii]NHF71097.1 hypothetical protein [Flavobacterium bernardetii]